MRPDSLHSTRGRLVGRESQLTVAAAHLERPTDSGAPTDNPVERIMYAASVLQCLPWARAETPSAATGTVMRPDTFRAHTTDAGFSAVDILPIEHDLFRFYQLIPWPGRDRAESCGSRS